MNTTTSLVERRAPDLQRGLLIEGVTIVWMVIEAAVAIGVGITTRSGAALAFGIDSLIELGSAGVLIWRLRAEFDRRPQADVEAIERKAGRIVGGALFALAVYVVLQSAVTLILRVEARPSLLGIGLALASLIGMPVLARVKTGVAQSIGSAALKGDAACSITCAYMAATLLGGLALNALFGWWWADPIAALGIVTFSFVKVARPGMAIAVATMTAARRDAGIPGPRKAEEWVPSSSGTNRSREVQSIDVEPD